MSAVVNVRACLAAGQPLFAHLFVCLFVCLFIYLFVYNFCLFVYIFYYLFVNASSRNNACALSAVAAGQPLFAHLTFFHNSQLWRSSAGGSQAGNDLVS